MGVVARLIGELDDEDLRALVRALEPHLPQPAPRTEDRWVTTKEAAGHLGITPNALNKLTAAREIPFTQTAPGCKCFFRLSDLDRWRSQ
jgi:excisionase family DNA binding protein